MNIELEANVGGLYVFFSNLTDNVFPETIFFQVSEELQIVKSLKLIFNPGGTW